MSTGGVPIDVFGHSPFGSSLLLPLQLGIQSPPLLAQLSRVSTTSPVLLEKIVRETASTIKAMIATIIIVIDNSIDFLFLSIIPFPLHPYIKIFAKRVKSVNRIRQEKSIQVG